MDRLLIAEAAGAEYTESLKWYAERSLRAAERFDAAFEQALDSIAAQPSGIPCAMIGTGSTCSRDIRFKSSIGWRLRIDG